jgi:hypothetical protein
MRKNKLTLLVFVVLAGIAAWLWFNRSSGTLKVPLKNFAVQDTASITKIFMADRKGNTVLLERKNTAQWQVNGRYYARPDGINTLLYTIKNVEVKSPVGKNLYNRIMTLMATNAVKIEIYKEKELLKTYYVGHPTMDNLGTFMYLEGSSEPFITFIPGFNGYLTPRYFTNETEWRDRGLLKLDPKKILQVKIEDFARPARSMEVLRKPDSTYSVVLLKNNTPIVTEASRLRDYLMAFRAVNYHKLETNLLEATKDSIEAAGPFAKLFIREERSEGFTMQLYRMPVNELTRQTHDEGTGKPYPYDLDRMYVRLPQDTTWYIGQYFHFDNFMRDPASLVKNGPVVRQYIPGAN